jgi:uncharacterized Tic20 family protein
MSFLTVYFLIGLCIMFLIQYTNDKFVDEENKVYLNFFEVLFGVVIWPFILLLFIRALKYPPRD